VLGAFVDLSWVPSFLSIICVSLTLVGVVWMICQTVLYVLSHVPFVERLVSKLSRWSRRNRKAKQKIVIGVVSAWFMMKLWIGPLVVIPAQDRPETAVLVPTIDHGSPAMVYQKRMWHGCEMHLLKVDLWQMQPTIPVAKDMVEKSTLSKLVSQTRGEGIGVVAAVNAHFFTDGGVVGLLMNGGRMSSPHCDRSALGFAQNGTRAAVDIYRFSSEAGVAIDGDKYPIRQSYNYEYIPGDVGLYSSLYVTASGAGTCPRMIQARLVVDDQSRLNAPDLVARVAVDDPEAIVENPRKNLQPRQNELILVAGDDPGVPSSMSGPYAWAKKHLRPGTVVKVNLHITPMPPEMVVTGGPEFLRDGKYFAQSRGNEKLCNEATARTAVGITPDKRYLLVVVADGPPKWGHIAPKKLIGLLPQHPRAFVRGAWDDVVLVGRALWLNFWAKVVGLTRLSSGLTMPDMAQFMLEQKVEGQPITSAINLDGGESSTMVVYGAGPTVVSHPMEGSEAALATGIGFAPRTP